MRVRREIFGDQWGVPPPPQSANADSSPAHGAGEPWVIPLRRSTVEIGGVCRGTVMTVPYIGIVAIRRSAVGIGGVYCGTARRPFPTDEFHTQSGE